MSFLANSLVLLVRLLLILHHPHILGLHLCLIVPPSSVACLVPTSIFKLLSCLLPTTLATTLLPISSFCSVHHATDAFKNPAPEASLIQKHKRILFGSAYFLEHFGVTRPEDTTEAWSALTATPNPFNHSAAKMGAKKTTLLTDASCAIIAEGLTWFYENAPTAKDDTLVKWVPSQLQQPDHAALLWHGVHL